MAFIESPRFPTDISYGSSGGPNYNTTVIPTNSGYEYRNQNWANPRYSYDVAYGVKDLIDLQALIDYFHRASGKLNGFRYKDHSDYAVTDEALAPDGGPTVQLIKTYGSGSNTWVRSITKPVSGVTFKHNGSPIATSPEPSLDTTTGILTLTPDATAIITSITQANPGVVTTSAAHGYSNGDEIYIENVGGMTEVNDTVFIIANATPTTFTIVNTTSYTAYTSGGDADKYVQSTDALTWTGEFDVPVRFDVDTLSVSIDDYQLGAAQVPLVEIRI
jgi:uncharacterized protein (TIGR02217 family)